MFWNSGGLATRACGEEVQPILVLSRNKDPLYYYNWVGPEAPRGCTGLKTESSRLATLGFGHMASARLPSVLYGVLLALHERQHCGEIQIRTQHRKQQSEGKQAAGLRATRPSGKGLQSRPPTLWKPPRGAGNSWCLASSLEGPLVWGGISHGQRLDWGPHSLPQID